MSEFTADAPEAQPESSPLRQQLVRLAIETWKRQLIDLGGRNNLLYFRDLKVGTLDLTSIIDTEAAARLIEGRATRLSQLFLDPDRLKDAARRARTIRAKAVENAEERGLQTLHAGIGLATWRSDRSASTPNAPVLLYNLTLKPIGVSGEDFEVQVDPLPEINPTLLHLLETDFGEKMPAFEPDVEPETLRDAPELLDRVRRQFRSIPGFAIEDRIIAGNFSYAKLPMVHDLDRAADEIAAHVLLSSIAGDAGAREEIRERHAAAERIQMPVVPPPRDEFLILDADSSQSRVIAAAVTGADVVVIGPPGTGKSQTISNLIATLAARGRSVLFVAEKRAAIEAVVERLNNRGLGDLVLDLHDGATNRRKVAEDLQRTLAATGNALEPDLTRLHQQLSRRRDELEAYADQLHLKVAPWDISAFEAQSRILGIPANSRTEIRLRGAILDTTSGTAMSNASEDARRFIELGGPRLTLDESPWSDAYAMGQIAEPAIVENVLEHLHSLRLDDMPKLRAEARRLAAAAALREPTTLGEIRELVDLLEGVQTLLESFRPELLEADTRTLSEEMLPASKGVGRLVASLFDGGYRKARQELRSLALSPLSDSALLAGAELALSISTTWAAIGVGGSRPATVDFNPLQALYEPAQEDIAVLTGHGVLAAPLGTLDEIEARLAALDGDRALLTRFPELHRLESEIRVANFGPVLDESLQRNGTAEEAAAAIEHAWLASVLERLYVQHPALAAFEGVAQDVAVSEFGIADRSHIGVADKRVRRAWAERAVATRDAFPDEALQVARQASLKRRHMPIRDLFEHAEHVLTAVKPCWVMSPLVVAQVLPARPCFDVVIFDEASQILPADAACSLLRANQAVIAGDPHQLPPTTFFSSGTDDEPDDDEGPDEAEARLIAADTALTQGQESILDVLTALLPPPLGTRVLSWHYRSKDERLITFSNAQESLYEWSLTTFPGALPGDAISHVLVPHRAGNNGPTASNSDEVQRVVELVLEHATLRPAESLGIIGLGVVHADRIAEALRLAAANSPALAAMLDEERDERLFVKNLERVQGDERDAIILSVGYGKNADGRMRYNFGPINQQGGQRRLNVAITRARRRITVVSSFSGAEMDPARLNGIGPVMLRDYLLYAESGGKNLGLRALTRPALNPFERDVKQHLEARGLTLVPQFGASGYWIDFAVMHPVRPGEPILAIEADGVMYHSSASARDRDRLRQEHLERLGWKFHRIWSTDWFRSREAEVERAVAAYEEAVGLSGESAAGTILEEAEALDWLPEEDVATPGARGKRPAVRAGMPIGEYSLNQLVAVVRWVKSDGRLYTEDELLSEVMKALGFTVRGKRIVPAILQAISFESRQ